MTSIAPLLLPGSNGRLGIIQPAPGLMLEAEWARALPSGVAYPVTRLALHGVTEADYDDMAARAPAAAAILGNAGADVIGYACGIGSLYRGPEAERLLMVRLREAAGGIPVIGMAEAALGAIRARGARRVAVLTPYAPAINALVEAYLRAAGLAVTGIFRLPVDGAIAAAGLLPEETIAAAVSAMRDERAEALWIPCSNVRTLDLLESIEAVTGRAAISSNEALRSAMLAALSRQRETRSQKSGK